MKSQQNTLKCLKNTYICVTRCPCVLHTYKTPSARTWGRSCPTTLLASPSLVHFCPSHPVLLHCYRRKATLHSSTLHMVHNHGLYSLHPTRKKDSTALLSLCLANRLTNEVNEDECRGTVLLTSHVCNCGPVLQGHGGKDKEETEIDLIRRNYRIIGTETVWCGVNHNHCALWSGELS